MRKESGSRKEGVPQQGNYACWQLLDGLCWRGMHRALHHLRLGAEERVHTAAAALDR